LWKILLLIFLKIFLEMNNIIYYFTTKKLLYFCFKCPDFQVFVFKYLCLSFQCISTAWIGWSMRERKILICGSQKRAQQKSQNVYLLLASLDNSLHRRLCSSSNLSKIKDPLCVEYFEGSQRVKDSILKNIEF